MGSHASPPIHFQTATCHFPKKKHIVSATGVFVATLGASEILVSVKRRFVGLLGALVIRVSAKRLFKHSHRETYFLRGGGVPNSGFHSSMWMILEVLKNMRRSRKDDVANLKVGASSEEIGQGNYRHGSASFVC